MFPKKSIKNTSNKLSQFSYILNSLCTVQYYTPMSGMFIVQVSIITAMMRYESFSPSYIPDSHCWVLV